MSTINRRKRALRSNLGPYKIYELFTGECIYPLPEYYSGYGNNVDKDLTKFISDEMRSDWHNNRDELMQLWESGDYFEMFPPWLFICRAAGNHGLPWAVEHLDQRQ